jgi:hypothetical protein
MTTIVIHIKDKDNPKVTQGRPVAYCGRSAKPLNMGNPFILTNSKDPEERQYVINKHDEWLDGKHPGIDPQLRLHQLQQIPKLKGYALACYCAPQPCHAQNFIKRMNQPMRPSPTITPAAAKRPSPVIIPPKPASTRPAPTITPPRRRSSPEQKLREQLEERIDKAAKAIDPENWKSMSNRLGVLLTEQNDAGTAIAQASVKTVQHWLRELSSENIKKMRATLTANRRTHAA